MKSFGIAFLLIAGWLVYHFIIDRWRSNKIYRKHLEPILESHGLKYVSERYPGFFKLGPFGKFEIQFMPVRTRVAGVSGEYEVIKVVTFRDETGKSHDVWVNLEFVMFSLSRIRWRAPKGVQLPDSILPLLE